jgi:hypothetical protein
MDRAGLAAVMAVLTGCGSAAADGEPTPALPPGEVLARLHVTPPAGWTRLPAVEAAAAASAGKIASAVTEIEAWGDPGAGCYAIAIVSRGKVGEPIAASVNRMGAGLAALAVDPATLPKPVDDVLDVALPITTGVLTGTVQVRMFRTPDRRPQAVALACAGNAREPARCLTQCQAMAIQLAPPVAP